MQQNFIRHVRVEELWGQPRRNIDIQFKPEVNIIIGPNASGKSTVLNLMLYLFAGEIPGLMNVPFKKLFVEVAPSDLEPTRTPTEVVVKKQEKEIELRVNQEKCSIPLELFDTIPSRHLRNILASERPWANILDKLAQLVPAVWLPTSRRLPTLQSSEEDYPRSKTRFVESVDQRLSELAEELRLYCTALNRDMSAKYREFQKDVLLISLYKADYDRLSLENLEHLTDENKAHLFRAFRSAGASDSEVLGRIDSHWKATKQAIDNLIRARREKVDMDVDDVLLVPLWSRTIALANLSQGLEQSEEAIYQPLTDFGNILQNFLTDKDVSVSRDGEISIASKDDSAHTMPLKVLSSGEKQLLILLIQALVTAHKPVVYVADEPELSLHVTWQSNLLPSLRKLAPTAQIIVATHSPDIASAFPDRIISLETK